MYTNFQSKNEGCALYLNEYGNCPPLTQIIQFYIKLLELRRNQFWIPCVLQA